MRRKNKKNGFSLIELIVVIAILGILTALLAPSIYSSMSTTKEKADLAAVNNLQSSIQTGAQQSNTYKDAKKIADEDENKSITMVYKVNDDHELEFHHMIVNKQGQPTDDFALSLFDFRNNMLNYLSGKLEVIEMQSDHYREQEYHYKITFPDADFKANIEMSIVEEGTTNNCSHANCINTKIDSTCTEEGDKITVCDSCGYTAFEKIPMKPHEYKTEVKTRPTCTTAGENKQECAKCGHVSSTSVVPALGHSYKQHSSGGNIITYKCERAGCTSTYREFTYSIVYKSASGTTLGTESKTSKEGTTVTIPAKSFVGYITPSSQSIKFNQAPPRTITFTYEPAANTRYIVQHWQENVNDNNYVIVETEEKTGMTGSTISPPVKTYKGFKSPATITTTIAPDGSTVINYKYSRNTYSYIIRCYSSENRDVEIYQSRTNYYKYGSKNVIYPPSITGYVSPSSMTLNWTSATNDAWLNFYYTPSTNTRYTVYHYTQNVDGNGYTQHQVQTLSGKTESSVSPAPLTITGFTSPPKQTITIKPDGSGSIRYDYTRNKYTHTIVHKTTTGSILQTEVLTNYYNSTHRVLKTFVGYTLSYTSVSDVTWTNNNSRTITLSYEPNTNTVYTVKHYKMNSDGTSSDLADTDNLRGTTNTQVTPPVKNYPGFTAPTTQTVTIKADGTTVVEYYYTRNQYTHTFKCVTPSGNVLGTFSKTFYFSSSNPVTFPDYTGYITPPDQSILVSETRDVTHEIVYQPRTDIVYTVIHKQEDLNADTYTIVETETKYGTANSVVSPARKSYTGFTAPATQSVTVKPDGSTVVEYLYKRNSYTYYVYCRSNVDNSLLFTTTTTPHEYYDVDYVYPPTIPGYRVDPSKPYFYLRWSSASNSAFVTFYFDPVYTCTVNYYQATLNSSSYSRVETQTYEVVRGSTFSPTVKSYAGFVSPAAQSISNVGSAKTINYYYDREMVYLDIKLYVAGELLYSGGQVTFDVYVNGTCVGNDVADYWTQWPYGTPYSITDIRSTSSHEFLYIHPAHAPASGTLQAGGSSIYLVCISKTGKQQVSISNGMSYYLAGGGGTTGSVTQVSPQSGNPSGIEYKITSYPSKFGWTGYWNSVVTTNAPGTYYHKIIAKLPVGAYLDPAANGGHWGTWLTSNAGTGKWETYIYKWEPQYTGEYQNFGYILLNSYSSGSTPIVWYVGYNSIFGPY